MKKILETERLFLTKISIDHLDAMFELDSDPLIHRYTGTDPLKTRKECLDVIAFINKQYDELGTGRLAVHLKSSGEFIGWSGLKYINELIDGRKDFYELGYRFIPRFWGKGYATESARGCIEFGFQNMNIPHLTAFTDIKNNASHRVLQKLGFEITHQFDYDGTACNWHHLDQPKD